MSNSNPVVINSTKYNSISEALLMNNISEATMYRIRRLYNFSSAEAIEKILSDRGNGIRKNSGYRKPLTVRGITFESISKALRHFDINDGHMRSVMFRYNFNTESAIEYILADREENGHRYQKDHRGKYTVINGKEYISIKAAADDNGVNYYAVKDYIKKGMSGEEAIYKLMSADYTNKRHNKNVVVDGITYDSIKAAAIANGVNYGTLTQTTSKYGISVEDAIHRLTTGIGYKDIPVDIEEESTDVPNTQPDSISTVTNKPSISIDDAYMVDMVIKCQELKRQINELEDQLSKKKAEYLALKQTIIDTL